MLNSYQAIIENGHIKWLDRPPAVAKAKVIVTVLADTSPESINKHDANNERKLGFMQGEMTIPDDVYWGDEEVHKLFGVK